MLSDFCLDRIINTPFLFMDGALERRIFVGKYFESQFLGPYPKKAQTANILLGFTPPHIPLYDRIHVNTFSPYWH